MLLSSRGHCLAQKLIKNWVFWLNSFIWLLLSLLLFFCYLKMFSILTSISWGLQCNSLSYLKFEKKKLFFWCFSCGREDILNVMKSSKQFNIFVFGDIPLFGIALNLHQTSYFAIDHWGISIMHYQDIISGAGLWGVLTLKIIKN